MPQPLARVTTRRASRPTRLTVRNRLLVGAAVLLATLVTPAASGHLPDPIDRLAGESQAHAQSRSLFVVDGAADDCDTGWTAVDDLCRIEAPACPWSPYNDIRVANGEAPELMQPSTDFAETSYPEFCEERVNENIDPQQYARCAADPADPDFAMAGFAVMLQSTGVGPECWALQLRTCEVGVQVSLDWCRAEVRRSWTCEADAIPRNEFPTCYRVQTAAATGQVCRGDAPALRLVSCEDYVGTDFTDAVMCDVYGNGLAWQMSAVANNPYWCAYDASLLSVACHDAAPPVGQCAHSQAMCLKRASGTGGCDGIARTIECRRHQSGYRTQAEVVLSVPDPQASDLLALAEQAQDVRQQGCEPCQALPFQPLPRHCPQDYAAEPVFNTLRRNQIDPSLQAVLDRQSPYGVARCASMPPGYATWLSTHPSGAAVVNSGVIVHVRGVPTTYRALPHSSFDVLGDKLDWTLITDTFAVFPEASGTPHLVRSYELTYPTNDSYPDAADLANRSLECIVEGLPAFQVVVEELWPDKDYDAITELFGPDSLDWWDALSDQHGNPDHDARRGRTQARGITYWPDLTSADARLARDDSLRTRFSCNTETAVVPWCRWTPTRSGYYRLKVGGAWFVSAREHRYWWGTVALRRLRSRVMNLDQADRDRTFETLAALGCGQGNTLRPDCALSPSVLGLNQTLTDILPTGPNDVLTPDVDAYRPERSPDHLYSLPGDHHRYGGMDLRVRFSESREFVFGQAYTETRSFGIQVHEVRVHTVTPSR